MSAPLSGLDIAAETLREHPGVTEAAALLAPDGRRILAVVPGLATAPVDLRDHLWATLGAADLPDVLVAVDALPADAAGLDTEGPGSHTFRAPSTPTEEDLAEIWAETLGRERVAADDNFLDLGGDSMTAALLLDLTNERLETGLTLGDLLSAPSLAAIAETVDRSRPAS
ncbi:phosphopantetheine-binding protein [Dactylosporangium sp. CA-052675]|uniref:phosphopantetheine-binding protein n=1 Tax=Dactylosporangium sp. CA-052675 TaxID=3239927 RepID=UPI003D89DA43